MNRISFLQKNKAVLQKIYDTPTVLKEKHGALLSKLQSQGREDSQGTGNKVTEHEAAFAAVLESEGFVLLPKQKKNQHLASLPESGMYYLYQLNGSQSNVDYQTVLIENKNIVCDVKYDLKHSTSTTIMLNDGWFHKDIVYVITFVMAKQVQACLALGQDIPSEAESEYMNQLIQQKKTINETHKKVESLRPYVRFANQYSCEQFTKENQAVKFQRCLEFLS